MKFLFVFAHPDDESFLSGGTIAKISKENQVILVTATKGEKGELGIPPLTTRTLLGKTREKELKRACLILGIKKNYILGFPDGKMEFITSVKIEKSIAKILKEEKPDVVITFDKNGFTNHPDHKIISSVTTSLFKDYKNSADKPVLLYHTTIPKSKVKILEKERLAYDAFGKMKGTGDDEITTVVNIKNSLDIKIEALKQHKTQNKDVQNFLRRGEKDLIFEYYQFIAANSKAIKIKNQIF